IKKFQDSKILEQIPGKTEKELIIEKFDNIMELFFKISNFDIDIDTEYEQDILLQIRKEYYDMSEALYGYEMEALYMGELLENHIIRIKSREGASHVNIDRLGIRVLINSIEDILYKNSANYDAYTNIVSSILSILPFRMSKLKYFDILHDALMKNLNDYPIAVAEEWIDNYKRIFDNTLHDNYGIMFGDYFTDIQRFKSQPIDGLDTDALEDMIREVMSLSSDIRELRMLIIDIGVMINRLMIILLHRDEISYQGMGEDAKIFKNWRYGVEEGSLTANAKEEFMGWMRKLDENLSDAEAIEDESIARGKEFHTDSDAELSAVREASIYYNDIAYSKYEMLFTKSKEMPEGYLERLIDNLIEYIDRSIVSMGAIERKIRMRRLLSVLDLPFQNIDEFLSHIEYSLNAKIVSEIEILDSMKSLANWVEEFEVREA
ncbi:MAG: hypothetical protein GX329_02090, partial [Tissierellia bacterium]|nr:hypothetical protein [Tissierellia bacterium]